MRTVRQALSVVGRTQASIVSPLVRSSEAESGISTRLVLPLKDRAEPYLPEALQVALLIVPLLLLPDTSLTTVPVPSLKL